MLRATAGGVTLAIRAQPGAKKTSILGVHGEGAAVQLKVSVQAPPVDGRANAALISFLAMTFSLPKNRVELIAGESSRNKIFVLRDLTQERATALLAPLIR